MTWIIRQTLFRQNVEIENSPNFNDVKVSQFWYLYIRPVYSDSSAYFEISS